MRAPNGAPTARRLRARPATPGSTSGAWAAPGSPEWGPRPLAFGAPPPLRWAGRGGRGPPVFPLARGGAPPPARRLPHRRRAVLVMAFGCHPPTRAALTRLDRGEPNASED